MLTSCVYSRGKTDTSSTSVLPEVQWEYDGNVSTRTSAFSPLCLLQQILLSLRIFIFVERHQSLARLWKDYTWTYWTYLWSVAAQQSKSSFISTLISTITNLLFCRYWQKLAIFILKLETKVPVIGV